jgi:hypothetical protein
MRHRHMLWHVLVQRFSSFFFPRGLAYKGGVLVTQKSLAGSALAFPSISSECKWLVVTNGLVYNDTEHGINYGRKKF